MFLKIVSIPYRYYKNDEKGKDYYIITEFQFLIGTIKTTRARQQMLQIAEVSIPYRYYKNVLDHLIIGDNGS